MLNKTLIDEGYLDHLRQRITYEENRLSIMVKNTVGLLVAAAFSLPIIAVNPLLPFIGALIAVLTTILNMIATQRIEQQKPDDKLTYIPTPKGTRFVLFQPIEAKALRSTDNIHETLDKTESQGYCPRS